ncbi:proline oxidase PrnD [Rhizodiscina lignyota]|uniref:Proline dehydrogenase n=1 Tax=Rhizodiscina lignyota TaxID=1504668 RepID=A0A9P4M6E5_9PEZI|nr:proline oxidase PrnD [Rhizodiscina lignyota]
MASSVIKTSTRTFLKIRPPLNLQSTQRRPQASLSTQKPIDTIVAKEAPNISAARPDGFSRPPLARLSTSSIVRNLLLSAFFTSPVLFRPAFYIFEKIANSKSAWLNPDRNPLLRAAIHPNQAEIAQTSSEIRRLGFSGVVLCYGKEVQVQGGNRLVGYANSSVDTMEAEIDQWANGNLLTLDMIGEGDWLGIKYTGAGPRITEALLQGGAAPSKFVEAMDRICDRAASKGCRIWIDAEQQVLQKTIDQWTFDLMRRHNRPGKQALIYNTIQAYLKSSRGKLQHQLELSQKEGWRLGIKLVRGAYINNDIRDRIHDTKADTDASYNGIVEDVLRGHFPALVNRQDTNLDLLLAGHNSESIRRATRLASSLAAQSKLKVVPEFGQLQGMAEDIGCELLQMADDVKKQSTSPPADRYTPKVYKCLTWGSIQECMQYLTRRLVENRGAASGMSVGAAEFRKELFRRLTGRYA